MSETIAAKTDLQSQAARFHEQIVELIKKYQFRDRGAVCCFGISVSQCYILEALKREGALTMNQLAEKMRLSVSTLTRVVGQLVDKGLAVRSEDPADRRVRYVQLTPQGEEMFRKLWSATLRSEREILGRFPEGERDSLIRFLEMLNHAVDGWQAQCSR